MAVYIPIELYRTYLEIGMKVLAKGQPKYLFIHNAIQARIHSGELKPGQSLPSEADLARKFQVSHMTVRQGLRELEADGFIVRQ